MSIVKVAKLLCEPVTDSVVRHDVVPVIVSFNR